MSEPILKKLVQIGIIVPDAVKAAENFCEVFEVDPETITVLDTRDNGKMTTLLRGEEIESYNLIAMVPVANIEFEFIQYMGGDINSQKEFYDRCGAGIQHICIDVEDYQETVDRMRTFGAKTLVEGGGGDWSYKYMDMTESMGLTFELYNNGLRNKKMGIK